MKITGKPTGRGEMIGAKAQPRGFAECEFPGKIVCPYSGTVKYKGKMYCLNHERALRGV